MKNYFFYCLCCLAITCLISCKKSPNEPDSGGTYLSAISYSNTCPNCTANSGVIKFSYNSNHQLVSVISSSDTFNFTTLYTYNASGQFVGESESNSVVGLIEKFTFLYDAQGRIIKETGIPYLANLAINDITFAYDAANRVIGDSTHNLQTNNVLGYRVFEYDNTGNINKITTVNILNGTPQAGSVQNFTYNDKLNPYYTIKDVNFFFTDDPLTLSGNMVIDTSPIQYTYYSNGLPRESVFKDMSIGSQSVNTYTYEP
jgi:YD repeat-containing protein